MAPFAMELRLTCPHLSALVAFLVALSAAILPGIPALAQDGSPHGAVHPEVTRRAEAARRAPAHQAYAELRFLWQENS